MLPDGAPTRWRSPAVAGVAVLLALAYSWLAGHFATFTHPAEVATFIPGLVAVAVAARRADKARARPGRRRSGWWLWVLIAGGFTAVELVALTAGADRAHPTVSDLVNPWLGPVPGRAAAFAVWLALGYWLSRR